MPQARCVPQEALGSTDGRSMAARWTVGVDAQDPAALAAFWAFALGYVPEPGENGDPDAASIIDPAGAGPAIALLRVPESKTSKNRFHIDIRVAGGPPWDSGERAEAIRTMVDRLVGRGATTVREEWYGHERGRVLGHVVMLDPEGNEFCVA